VGPTRAVIEEIGPMPVAPHGGEQPVVAELLATVTRVSIVDMNALQRWSPRPRAPVTVT
jgi:hypothetical protein